MVLLFLSSEKMIEVDSVRRSYNLGAYEQNFLAPPHPLGASYGPPHYDGHRVLVHWNQPALPNTAQPSGTGARSDEDDDGDDSEDRPFTPPPPRERLSYTRYQLELLNGIFEEVRYPNSTQKQLIAKRVGITRDQVKIWFQNRRRKDVIGTSGKPGKTDKTCDTSTSSTGSSKDPDSMQNSPVGVDGEESNSSAEENSANSSVKDDTELVVPSLVMKSVIGELIKFKNDPLKGKKNRKKKTRKQKEKVDIKKGLATTLLAGSYDMINPPNQITPTAFFEKMKSSFNHSKNSSAFARPRETAKPAQISSISSTTGSPPSCSMGIPGNGVSRVLPSNIPSSYPSSQSAFPFPSGLNSNFSHMTHTSGVDLPILSELLTGKAESNVRANEKSRTSGTSSVSPPVSSSFHLPPSGREANKNFQSHPGLPPFSPARSLNGIYPYPFLAEQPMLLSSLRQHDQIFRPAPQYPMAHFSEDPYQPLFISSLSNPYYSPPTWQSSNPVPQNSTSAYTQL